MPTAYVHIGLHKTGSTSIQAFLQAHRQALLDRGLAFYQGQHFPDNHVELHVASMRAERQSGFKNRSAVCVDADYIQSVHDRVVRFTESVPSQSTVFSSEGLSLLRYIDEVENLQRLIPLPKVKVVAYLRNPVDYLRSYTNQIRKDPRTLPELIERDSFAYTEPDTWLLDFEARLAPFRDVFGSQNLTVIDYDTEMARVGNVIPSFLQVLGVGKSELPQDWPKYFLGKS
jgi:hypothetical protein